MSEDKLTHSQKEILGHAIAMTEYVAEQGTRDWADCCVLASKGLMKRYRRETGGDYFVYETFRPTKEAKDSER